MRLSSNSRVLDYFESNMRGLITEQLSDVKNWWKACIPHEIGKDATARYESARKLNNVLNKPDYGPIDYLNFDEYERIITKRDNWKKYFEGVFLDKSIFMHKMRVILSLRNDVRHGRLLDEINSIRLRIHCYDVLAQIYESRDTDDADLDAMAHRLGFRTGTQHI